MSFQDDLFKITGGLAPPTYRITLLGETGAFIEGVNKILDIKSNQITISCGKTTLIFEGKNIKISSYLACDLHLKGQILKVEKR